MSAFFIVLLGGKGVTSVFPAVTGVAASGQVGSVTAGSEQIVNLAGVSGSALLGSVIAFADVAVATTGVAGSANVGNAIALSESDFLVTGVSGSAIVGSVTATGSGVAAATGVSASGTTGQIVFQQGVAVSAAGVSASGQVSGVTVQEGTSVSLTGVSASGQVSNVAISATRAISVNVIGVSGSAFVGSAEAIAGNYVAYSSDTSPYIAAYPWSSLGFGSRFSNPATLPAGKGYDTKFSPSGKAIAVGHENVPLASAYPWSDSGFGTKYANPSTPIFSSYASVRGLDFTSSGDVIAFAYDQPPYLAAYGWSDTSGFGTRFSSPGATPPGVCNSVAFMANNAAVAVAHNTSPFVSAYPWSSGGFGTKYSNPSVLPSGTCMSVDFNGSGTFVALAELAAAGSQFHQYAWSASTGFGVRSTRPAVPSGISGTRAVKYDPVNEEYLIVGLNTYAGVPSTLIAYENYSTRLSNPATSPTSSVLGIAFSRDGSTVFASVYSSTVGVVAYEWDGPSGGFGVKYSDPASFINNGRGVDFT